MHRPATPFLRTSSSALASLDLDAPPLRLLGKRKGDLQDAVVEARLRPVYVLLDGEAEIAAEGEQPLSEDELIARLKSEFDAEEFEEAEEFDAEEAR